MGKKILLWILTVIISIFLFTSFFIHPEVEVSQADLVFYRLNGVFLFIPILLGLLIELDIFHVKWKVPLAKSNKIIAHIGFWFVCIMLSFVFSAVFTGLQSEDFKQAIEQAKETKEQSDIENRETVEEQTEVITELTTEEDADDSAENGDITSENTNQSQSSDVVISTENESTTEKNESVTNAQEIESVALITEKSYNLDNITYEINGVEVTFRTAKLAQQLKPEGYMLTLEYSLRNKNDYNCKFEISSVKQNSFCVDEQVATLATQSSWSNNNRSSYSLKGNENIDLIVDLLAKSETSEKTIDGITYTASELSEIYTNQNVVVNIKVSGISDNSSDSQIISFELK